MGILRKRSVSCAIALALSAVMCCSFAACGDVTETNEPTASTAKSSTAADKTETAPSATAVKDNSNNKNPAQSESAQSDNQSSSNDSKGVSKDVKNQSDGSSNGNSSKDASSAASGTKNNSAASGQSSGGKHTSDNDPTEYVPRSDSPTFVAEQKKAKAGEKNVAVEIAVKNNPGVASIAFDVRYDTKHLTMTDFQYNPEAVAGAATVPFRAGVIPPHLSMVNGSADITGDRVFATLYFDVASDASGKYSIDLSYDEDNVYNINETNIPFEVVNGSILVN